MDVRCEKCKTEYEFDDSRISEQGVTVKCTTCGHVFKVKKKALLLTVPVRPEDVDLATALPPPSAPATGSDKAREWKVRQASGNVFTFKELTTLQKWIVERKVARDDEISLTGESWKRLGNIAELASFFQVVEEAQKAQQPAPATYGMGGFAQGYPLPSVPAPAPAPPVQPVMMPQPMTPLAQAPSGGFALPGGPSMSGAQAPGGYSQSPPQVSVHITTPPHEVRQQPPAMTRRSSTAVDELDRREDLRDAGMKKGGGVGKVFVVLLLLAVLGAGGYYGYFNYWLPLQQQKEQELLRQQAEHDRQERERGEAAAKLKAQEEAKAKADALAKAAEAKDAGPAAPVVVEAPVDAGVEKKREASHDFNWYMNRGDKLREAERPEDALDAYGRAADMKPDRAEPMAGKGLALFDMGNNLQAEASFQQALRMNPRYGVALMGLAETYKALGKKQEAIDAYKKFIEELPSSPEASVARNAIKKLEE